MAVHHQPSPARLSTPSPPDATVGLRGSHLLKPASPAALVLAAAAGEQPTADVAVVAAGNGVDIDELIRLVCVMS